MLYKGGPKNYNRRDWQIVLGLIGFGVFATLLLVIIGAASGGRETALDGPVASREYREAAERAGYKGKEADQVGAAAEKLCQGTGQC